MTSNNSWVKPHKDSAITTVLSFRSNLCLKSTSNRNQTSWYQVATATFGIAPTVLYLSISKSKKRCKRGHFKSTISTKEAGGNIKQNTKSFLALKPWRQNSRTLQPLDLRSKAKVSFKHLLKASFSQAITSERKWTPDKARHNKTWFPTRSTSYHLRFGMTNFGKATMGTETVLILKLRVQDYIYLNWLCTCPLTGEGAIFLQSQHKSSKTWRL